MARQVVDGQDLESAIAIAGMSGGGGVAPAFGNGGLGDVVISTVVETSGDLHYNTLEVQAAGALTVTAGRKLVVRSISDIIVDGAIHADGRGFPGSAGGYGGSGPSGIGEGVAGSNTALDGSPALSGGGAGGGGARSGTSKVGGTGGTALDQNVHRANLSSLNITTTIAGGAATVGGGFLGDSPAAISATEIARYTADYGLKYRSDAVLGRGGSGGGGGAAATAVVGPGTAGGAAGLQSGANLGNGSNSSTPGSDAGSGGGGGGAGGGNVEVWCGGDLTIGASGRISARGGNGGNGGNGVNFNNGAGGGGGPGGGGFVGVFYSGVLTNAGTVNATAGSSGAAGTGGTGVAGASGSASAGVAILVKVAP